MGNKSKRYGNVVEGANVGDVHRNIEHVLHVATIVAQNGADVFQDLRRLGAQIPPPDDTPLASVAI